MNKLLHILFLLIPGISLAQTFAVGAIDFYGNRTIKASKLEAVLPFAVGDSLNLTYFDKDGAVKKLEAVSGVKKAIINTVCCDPQGGLLVFVGISEKPVASFYRRKPATDLVLPDSMLHAYQTFMERLSEGIRKGEMSEENDEGYAMAAYTPARKQQELFRRFATKHFRLVTDVLQSSKHDEHRAAAATITAYGNNKQAVASVLTAAALDTNETVRNNATRALALLVRYAQKHPELRVNIPAAPFIQMLNSFTWTDRNKGAMVLAELTSQRNKTTLALLKKQALSSLIEMARWKSRGHAFYAFMILGRMAGLPEEELVQKNFAPEHESFVAEIVKKL